MQAGVARAGPLGYTGARRYPYEATEPQEA